MVRKGREFVDASRAISEPWYADCVFNIERCTSSSDASPSQLLDPLVILPSDKKAGWKFSTFLIEPRFLIPWLRVQLEHFGVIFEKRRIESPSDLLGCDIVVYCVGLGARTVAKDETVRPVSGQVLMLRFAGLDQWVRDTTSSTSIGYVYPQRNTVVVGGTKIGEARTDLEALEGELKTRGSLLMPLIASAPSLGINGSYRPLRSTFRLEIDASSLNQTPKVIHNYGHGGEGYCFAPGCAHEVLRLVDGLLERTSGITYEEKALKRFPTPKL